jgi:hypothetical protein
VLSETRYAMNGDLRVAYRASPPGARDIVVVPNWFGCCDLAPENATRSAPLAMRGQSPCRT